MSAGRGYRGGIASLLTLGAVLAAVQGTALADPAPAPAESPVLAESFEAGPGLPTGWGFVEFRPGDSTATIGTGAAADGAHYVRIASPTPNHARVLLPVSLAASTVYRFRALARAGGVGAGVAAVLGVNGESTVTDSVRTDDRWQELDLYIESGAATAAQLTLGLGHFGRLNTGFADFDAVSVTPVAAPPAGAVVVHLSGAGPPTSAPRTAAELPAQRGPSPLLWMFVGVLGAACAVVVVGLWRDRRERAIRRVG